MSRLAVTLTVFLELVPKLLLKKFGIWHFQGSLKEMLSWLKEYEKDVCQVEPHLEELETINQQIQESFVLENRYTQCPVHHGGS